MATRNQLKIVWDGNQTILSETAKAAYKRAREDLDRKIDELMAQYSAASKVLKDLEKSAHARYFIAFDERFKEDQYGMKYCHLIVYDIEEHFKYRCKVYRRNITCEFDELFLRARLEFKEQRYAIMYPNSWTTCITFDIGQLEPIKFACTRVNRTVSEPAEVQLRLNEYNHYLGKISYICSEISMAIRDREVYDMIN